MNSGKSTGKTIGELINEARIKSEEPTLAGHDIMALERFADGTQHTITFDVLSHSSPVGNKGERMWLFLSENGYQKALKSQSRGECKILKHAKVFKGDILYDKPKQEIR